MTARKKTLLLAALLAAAMSVYGIQTRAADSAFTDAQKKEMGEFIRGYLKDNPDAVIDALNEYQRTQQQAQNQAFEKNFASKKGDIVSGAPIAGNPKGDVTIVEFYDYNCGYCKKAVEDIVGILEVDKNVKIVLRDLPILSPSSNDAARWALAADKQGKYYEYHVALMKDQGQRNEDTFARIGKELGLDGDKLRKDADSKDVRDAIEKNTTLSHELGIQGTPAFIVGDTMAPGYMGLDNLKQAVDAERKKAK